MVDERKLLKTLISIPSISGDENNIGNFVNDFLLKEGFKVTKIAVENRFCLIASTGKPKFYFSGHLDTVSPFIDFSEDDKYVYGRGACDTKASIACMLVASANSKKQGFGNFGLIFTTGEESTFDGVKEIVKNNLKIPFVIVGEPTSLEIINGHFGNLVIKLIVKGKSAHSSTPEEGDNAIDKLFNTVDLVKNIDIFSETSMSLVKIDGGIADNVIPDRAEVLFSFRISPNDKNNYLEKISKLLPKDVQIKTTLDIKSVKSEIPEELKFLKKGKTVKYCTELSFYKEGVVLGPGNIKYAHSNNEKINKAELKEAVNIYIKIIQNYSK